MTKSSVRKFLSMFCTDIFPVYLFFNVFFLFHCLISSVMARSMVNCYRHFWHAQLFATEICCTLWQGDNATSYQIKTILIPFSRERYVDVNRTFGNCSTHACFSVLTMRQRDFTWRSIPGVLCFRFQKEIQIVMFKTKALRWHQSLPLLQITSFSFFMLLCKDFLCETIYGLRSH